MQFHSSLKYKISLIIGNPVSIGASFDVFSSKSGASFVLNEASYCTILQGIDTSHSFILCLPILQFNYAAIFSFCNILQGIDTSHSFVLCLPIL